MSTWKSFSKKPLCITSKTVSAVWNQFLELILFKETKHIMKSERAKVESMTWKYSSMNLPKSSSQQRNQWQLCSKVLITDDVKHWLRDYVHQKRSRCWCKSCHSTNGNLTRVTNNDLDVYHIYHVELTWCLQIIILFEL